MSVTAARGAFAYAPSTAPSDSDGTALARDAVPTTNPGASQKTDTCVSAGAHPDASATAHTDASPALHPDAHAAEPARTAVAEGPAAAPGAGWRRIERAAGEAAVWMTPEEVLELGAAAHAAGHCGGFMDVTGQPPAVVVAPWIPTLPGPAFARHAADATAAAAARHWRAPLHASQQATVVRLAAQLDAAAITATVAALTQFGTRHYDSPQGAAAAAWIAARATASAAAAGRPEVTASLFAHGFAQPSVIVTVPGTGARASELVVLGAHADSINWEIRTRDAPAPGADDDASGVAILMGVLDALLEGRYRPQRTLQFMAYAGEEIGLVGSQEIAQAYRRAAVPVVAAWQLDMAMAPAPQRRIAFVTDQTSAPLTAFAGHLVDTYLDVGWEHTRCGYACSDHASWHRAGVATAFPFEAPFDAANPRIHTARDTAAGLDVDFGMQLARLTLALAVELADALP